MKKNHKNAFTLVELLAVIVILAIILVIAVPKVMSVIEDSKKATLESTAKMIASAAEKAKVQNTVLGKVEEITCDSVAKINKLDYEDCKVDFEENTAKVTIKGSGKFAGLYVCNADKTNATAQVESCKIMYDDVFSNNTWDQVIAACQSGNIPDTWVVGDTMDMTFKDGKTYAIRIIGKDHDTYVSGTRAGQKAPLTFQLDVCYGTKYKMNSSKTNAGGWRDSEMRNTHLPAILSNMPDDVQAAIQEVYKVTIEGGSSSTPTVTDTTFDKLFLLSEIEVLGRKTYSGGVAEGAQYDYYANGGFNGSSSSWWLRSPLYRASSHFGGVDVFGNLSGNYADNSAYGVAFGFCF